MAYCPKCGAEVTGQFCPKCGANVGAAAAAASTSGSTSAPFRASGLTNNVASALCYVIPIIGGIVFLILDPYNRDRKIRFDAFQSIFLAIGLIIVSIALSMLYQVAWRMAGLIHSLYSLACLILWVFLAIKAFQNQKVKLPVIGDIAEKQA